MIIFRYLTKEVYLAMLANILILLLIFISNQFVHFMHIAVNGHLTGRMVMIVLLLKMPQLLAVLLPLSLFLAILLAYGRLYVDSEMTVLFSNGVSFQQILKVIITLATGVMLLVMLLAFWVSPLLNRYANKLMVQGAFSPLELISERHFQGVLSDKWVFYVEDISKDHKNVTNIFVADQSTNITTSNVLSNAGVVFAKNGYAYKDASSGDTFLILTNGSKYIGIPGEKDYQITNFTKYGVRINQDHVDTKINTDEMSTFTLLNNYKDNRAMAELQWRSSMPIMVMVLSLLATPLSRVRTRQGRYAQLVPALLLYILYGNFMFIGRDWLAHGKVSPIIGMVWIHVLMLSIAIVLILRQRTIR